MSVPTPTHTCPKCTPEKPCYFAEGEIVSLQGEAANAPWTGMVLEVERDRKGRVYRVLWGPPPGDLAGVSSIVAQHSGEHRREDLIRFLVPLVPPPGELRIGGGGGREGVAHRFAPPAGP